MNGIPKTTSAAILGGVGGLALGGTLGYFAGKRSNRKNKRKRSRTTKNKTRRKRSSHKKSRRRYPYTAGKRRDTSRRRIRFTKNGQPYIILSSGKARFLKKSSVRNSRKRSGGRY